jgi:hypothetical protein
MIPMEFTAVVLLEDGRNCSHWRLQTVSIRSICASVRAGWLSALFGYSELFGHRFHDDYVSAVDHGGGGLRGTGGRCEPRSQRVEKKKTGSQEYFQAAAPIRSPKPITV